MSYRIIKTIGKHIVAQQALACGDEGIGIDESADLGIVITGLEVVQLRVTRALVTLIQKMYCFSQHFWCVFLHLQAQYQRGFSFATTNYTDSFH